MENVLSDQIIINEVEEIKKWCERQAAFYQKKATLLGQYLKAPQKFYPSAERILCSVADCFDMEPQLLHYSAENKTNRNAKQVSALTVFSYVCGEYGYTLKKMGEVCGRDHSTMVTRRDSWPDRYDQFLEHRLFFNRVLELYTLPKPEQNA